MDLPTLSKIEITPEMVEEIKNTGNEEFKKTEAYQKYCARAEKRRIQLKKQKRVDWWKNNWIGIVTLVATILTLIATVVFGLLQLLD